MIRFILASRTTVAAALVMSMLMPAGRAYAAEPETPPRAATLTLRESAIEHARKAALEPVAPSQGPVTRAQAPPRDRSMTRKVVGALLAGTAGFFAGGYIGAKIEGDCGGCDDPGLKGAIIGAPIGAAVGVVLGAMLF